MARSGPVLRSAFRYWDL